jgi:ATP-dependent helicase/nuclease subunit B
MSPRTVASAAARVRLANAREWLLARPRGEEVLVVAANRDAANELLRDAALERGAAFGWHRTTLPGLAAALAAEGLAREGAVPVGPLVAQALMARVVHNAREQSELGRFESAGGGPGLVRALAGALEEARLADIPPEALAAEAPELQRIRVAYESALLAAGLADRPRVFGLACARALESAPHVWLDRPTLLLDLQLSSALERELVRALAGRSPDLLATLPCGDSESEVALVDALGVAPERIEVSGVPRSLAALQTHLFEGSAPAPSERGDEITVISAPGESRECVELARRIHRLADDGVRFDRIAVLLRSPDEYRPHLVEALRRAGVPAHFARGAVQPDPAGRAFAALLACGAENLSARRFAEYLSLGEVPDADAAGSPPASLARADRWVAPDEEMVPRAVAEALGEARVSSQEEAPGELAADEAPVAEGTLRAPRHWEQLLVDAAVIGGRDRWSRRLAGLAHELELDLAALEDPDDPSATRLQRDVAALAALRDYALPLLEELAALPERAAWGEWLDRLSALATRALRRPARVLSVLAELAPMASVGPVGLAEVQGVIARRLLELRSPPDGARYGKVFVAPIEAARGLCFDVVFVPGLAEKLFPKKLEEEPILLDRVREQLPGLAVNEDRVMRERLLLRIAVGATSGKLVLSYPRLDLDGSRPRVPSFYALEALRAATGRLPGFDELARDAERVATARVGWPAPEDPAEAIDEAEHDLALLESLLDLDPERSIGTARYLLTANPHLGRALRFRARRWLSSWTIADGLVKPSDAAREAIAAHGLGARSFSPTALQNFASCPYKFFLYAVHRLAPREVPESIEEIPPLQRGSMVHDVQFALFELLRDEQLLPVTPERLGPARALLDRVLDETAKRYEDDLAPAIERVWRDGVESVRADLREWLRRASVDGSGFTPWLFELSFGLAGRRDRDPHSQDEPAQLDCGLALRGSIDLVERGDDDRVRVTDHKTGKVRVNQGQIVAGGEALQPVLYALATEKLFPDVRVESGRLYYCTSTGGFEDRIVPLDADARASAQTVVDVIGQALAEPFLPAAPAPGACRWCDYRTVCGPYEELRTARKQKPPLAPFVKLRELP